MLAKNIEALMESQAEYILLGQMEDGEELFELWVDYILLVMGKEMDDHYMEVVLMVLEEEIFSVRYDQHM